MKWTIAIIIFIALIYGANSLYENGYETGCAALIFFIILPYFGIMVANAYEQHRER